MVARSDQKWVPAHRGNGRTGLLLDPIALLTREHEMIREQLRMIEAIVGPRGANPHGSGMHGLAESDRDTLRQLFRFFTSRVGVHFKRESLLIAALTRTRGQKRGEREQFDTLLLEHRALKAGAAGILRKLNQKPAHAADDGGADPFGILTFVKRYRGHLACEERILYVLAEMRLTAQQKQWISQRMLHV
ncbi:MAG: hemerythrin domain-containing protein [Nitrospirota bacterium]